MKEFFLLSLIFVSCGTYSSKKTTLYKSIAERDYQKASQFLDKQFKSESKSRNKLLYFMDRGVVSFLNNEYEASNKYFNTADNINEDESKGFTDYLIKYTVNPMMTTYTAEDHEMFFVHYYKTLNYLYQGLIEDAVVECKRLNLAIEVLADKYKKEKNVYAHDAFAHVLMGLIYQSTKDYNNAFIAYRNAINILENPNYYEMFGLKIPEQLKKDIIYCAYKDHDSDMVEFYKEKFNLKDYNPKQEDEKSKGDLICFWNNGFVAKKQEASLTFAIARVGDTIVFTNTELGLVFSFYSPRGNDDFDLNILRVAIPVYGENHSIPCIGDIEVDDTFRYKFEKIEDIDKVARKTLEQRMHFELGEMLLRLAFKKASELTIKKQNQGLGLAFGLFNAISEQADTRNWQTLPREISYVRIKLEEGEHKISLKPILKLKDNDRFNEINKEDLIKNVKIKKGKTMFIDFNTIF